MDSSILLSIVFAVTLLIAWLVIFRTREGRGDATANRILFGLILSACCSLVLIVLAYYFALGSPVGMIKMRQGVVYDVTAVTRVGHDSDSAWLFIAQDRIGGPARLYRSYYPINTGTFVCGEDFIVTTSPGTKPDWGTTLKPLTPEVSKQ